MLSKKKLPEIIRTLTGTDAMQKILLLDNFFMVADIDLLQSKELENCLCPLLNSTDEYLQRSALSIMVDLTLAGKLKNTEKMSGYLYDFIAEPTSPLLVSIAVKYYTLITDNYSAQFVTLLKKLTDNEHGDIASDPLYALGCIQLADAGKQTDTAAFLVSISLAETYFAEASIVAENRVDAQFTGRIVRFLKDVATGSYKTASNTLQEAKDLFLVRQLYELDDHYLEFDYMICQIFDKLQVVLQSLERARAAAWTDYRHEFLQLIRANQAIQQLKAAGEKHQVIFERVTLRLLVLDFLYIAPHPL